MKCVGKTVRLTGSGLNRWFAEQIVKNQGSDAALENTSGPMREAVMAVIAEQACATHPTDKGQTNE